ncbi:MAG: sugar-binding transcriptional regulator [Alphaproteobacteria bacterium]
MTVRDISTETELLTNIARRYYDDNATQEEIARELGLSRMKINRLLKQAHEQGVVEVYINVHPSVAKEIERDFIARYGLKQALIAPDDPSFDRQRASVGRLVGRYLESHLREGSVVAVSTGRNVAAVADTNGPPVMESGTFVCATGGTQRGGESGIADHICRKLSQRFGGSPETLYAPALLPDPILRRQLLQNDTVRRTMQLARQADFALVGIGDLAEDSHMVRLGWFKREEVLAARAAGVVGAIMGYDFFDIDGQERNEVLGGRVIGLSLDDLRNIKNVILVAGESSKATSILGALRTGAVDILATSLANVHSIMAMDRAYG